MSLKKPTLRQQVNQLKLDLAILAIHENHKFKIESALQWHLIEENIIRDWNDGFKLTAKGMIYRHNILQLEESSFRLQLP